MLRGIFQTVAQHDDIIGLSPQHGSHEAALTTMSYDRTEVSLSPCAGHRAPAATQVSGAALYRSVMDHHSE